MKSLMLLVGHEPHVASNRPWALARFLCCPSGRASGCASAPLPRPFQPAKGSGGLLRHWSRASLGCALGFRSALGRPRPRAWCDWRPTSKACAGRAEVEAPAGARLCPTLCSALLQSRFARQRLRLGRCFARQRLRLGTPTLRQGAQRAPRASAALAPTRPSRCPATRACTAPHAVPLPLRCCKWPRILSACAC